MTPTRAAEQGSTPASDPGSPEHPVGERPWPTWRGRLHQAAFFVAVPAGIALVSLARTGSARVAALIYGSSLVGLYGVSGAYHQISWSPRARLRLKRLDHCMIFVLIAGTVTPLGLLVLNKPWSVVLLAVVWGGAAAGITLKMVRIEGFPILTGALYIILGWTAILLLPQFIHDLSPVTLALLGSGGLLYTGGSIVLLRRKPDPAPATFGYHEVWHSMVIAASACHYGAVLLILLPGRSVIG